MPTKRRGKRASEWGPRGHWQLPKVVMLHEDFRSLSAPATKVLMVMGSQFNGKNNGNLSCSQKTMRQWGGMAPKTLANALKELRERDLIRLTRTHHWNSSGARCALYGLSWLPIDDCDGKDLDENALGRPVRSFK